MQKLLRSKTGTTLVELIVSFALTALFLTAAAVVVAFCSRIYARANAFANAQTVADMLLETATSQLGAAADAPYPAGEGSTACVVLGSGGSSVCFVDENAYPVVLSAQDGRLQLAYQPVTTGVGQQQEEVLWFYGDASYLDTTITALQFSYPKPGSPLVKVELTLLSTTTGQSYAFSRVVRCANLEGSDLAAAP